MTTNFKTITATPVSPTLGAVIGGVDIATGVNDKQLSEIKQAFADYAVIFFHDQDITPDQHIEFAERWGQD